jgi:hypothetical protein
MLLGLKQDLIPMAEKNRGRHLVENIVESHIQKSNIQKYYKEMHRSEIVAAVQN